MTDWQHAAVSPNNRVLVIDDNPQIHEDLGKILGQGSRTAGLSASRSVLFGDDADRLSGGFQVDFAFQGEQGYEMIRDAHGAGEPYAVAFVDVRMPPGWDGIKTIKHIWQVDPAVQIVICTAYADYAWHEIIQELGHPDQWLVLKKPFDNIEVRQLACALAEKWRLSRQAELKMSLLEKLVDERTASLRAANEKLIQEIEERERAQAEAREKDEQLRHAQKMELVGALAGGVAHEFNNLLQVISGYTRYAMDELDPQSEPYQDLDEVVKAADKAASLTSQLLGFSRRQPLKMSYLDPRKLLEDLAKLLRPVIGDMIELTVETLGDPEPIYGDATQLHQVLLNLCLNARDAMPNGGRLILRCQQETICDRRGPGEKPLVDLAPGEYVVFTVQDTGCGMTPEVMERIFDPFFTTKDVGKGTGLGLAMVYGIVQQHQGAIHVESELGVGTTFRVYLPVASPVAETPEVSGAGGIEESLRGSETVLVAEDEPSVRKLAVRSLQRAGYKAFEATTGQEAIELFEQHADEIDLVVLDVMMPGMTGRQAYERIKSIRPDVQAIFCTAYDPTAGETDFAEQCGLPLLQKPYRSEQLLRTIRDCLNGSREQTQTETFADALV